MTDNSDTFKAGRTKLRHAILRASGVPSTCWDVSASKTGRPYLRTNARIWANDEERGSIRPGMYFYGPVGEQQETVALAAKEAILAGLDALHISYHMLAMRLPAWQRAEGNPDIEYPLNGLFGRGLLAVHTVPPAYSVTEQEGRLHMDTLAWIVSHVDHGGLLAICGDHPLQGRNSMETEWPGELLLPIRRYCNVYEV